MSRSSILMTMFIALPGLASAQLASVDSLAWMGGCWENDGGSTRIVEQWMSPAGGMMLGMSRTTRDERLLGYEYMRIWSDADGDIYFTALPSGQSEASFRLVRWSSREAIFENPEHDFPQHVIYALADDGGLNARIEGPRNGTTRSIDFAYRPAECTEIHSR